MSLSPRSMTKPGARLLKPGEAQVPIGLFLPGTKSMAAARMTIPELADYIGCTSLGYLSVEGAQKAVDGTTEGFCTACFTGKYPLEIPEGLKKHAFDDPPPVGEMATVTSGQAKLFEP